MSELKYILRESYVMGCVYLYHVSFGIALALPAIVAPTLTQDGSDIRGTDEQSSWFLTSCGLMMPISYIILPSIMQVFGRRCAFIIANCSFVIGSIVIASASNVTSLIIGRAIYGIAYGGVLVSVIMVAEYTHPKRRSFSVVFRLFISNAGLLLGHFFGSKLAWRELAWLSTILSSLSIIGTFKCPESPAWFAYKERYDDCARSFKYMRGEDAESINELNELIAAQRIYRDTKSNYGTSLKATAKSFQSKEFLKVMGITALLTTLFETSGCNYIIVNLVSIMTKMTEDQSTAYYFTMGFDFVRITSVVLSVVILRVFNRKTVLLWSAIIGYSVLMLVCIAYYTSFVKEYIKIKWFAPTFLLMYEAVCSSGLFSVIIVCKTEILPLNFRGVGIALSGLILGLGDAVTSKVTPMMFKSLGIHGTFGMYLCICVVLFPFVYFSLPETKDKALQVIENQFIKLNSNRTESKNDTLKISEAVPLVENHNLQYPGQGLSTFKVPPTSVIVKDEYHEIVVRDCDKFI